MFPNSVLRLAKTLLKQATEAKLTLAFAESCTGGLIAAAVTELDGASAVVDRGFVVYSNSAKSEMLGVLEELDHVRRRRGGKQPHAGFRRHGVRRLHGHGLDSDDPVE